MTAHTISKTLSPNDVGDTGAHQAGMHIPKQEEILSFFPALDTATKNPRCIMRFVDDAGSIWKFAFIYYNNKFFGGTRNEYRLTRMTPFINEHQLRAGLRADTDPVQAGWCIQGAVGFDCDFEARGVKCLHQWRIELQQRLAAGTNYQPPPVRVCRPAGRYGRGQCARVVKFAAARPVSADKVRVAKAAHGLRPVGLAAAPQIASGKTAKHRGATGLRALALQRVIDFLDAVAHAIKPAVPERCPPATE